MRVRANVSGKVTLINNSVLIIWSTMCRSWLLACRMISRHMPGLDITPKHSMRQSHAGWRVGSSASLSKLRQRKHRRRTRSRLWLWRRRSQRRHRWACRQRKQRSLRVVIIGVRIVAINLDKPLKEIKHKKMHNKNLSRLPPIPPSKLMTIERISLCKVKELRTQGSVSINT